MKKLNKSNLIKYTLILTIIFLVISIVLTIINFDNNLNVVILNNNQSIYTNQELLINYTINKDKQLTFISDDPNIATVDNNGNIKGINPGNTIIRIKYKDKELSLFNITILKIKDKLELNIEERTIDVDETFSIIAKLNGNIDNTKVTFTSQNESILTVDNNGLATGISNGTTSVLVTTYEDITDSIIFTVEQQPKDIEVKDSISLIEGNTYLINATVLPDTTVNKELTFLSKNTDIATVDENGRIKAIKEGTAKILVSIKDIVKEITVTVENKGINSITFLYQKHDVGDAIVLSSNGHYAMVDTGWNKTDETNIIINYLKKNKITKLDFVLITHAHDDHIGGLEYLAKKVKIERIYVKNYNSSSFTKSIPGVYTYGIKSAKDNGAKITYINSNYKDGDYITFQDMKLTLYNTQKLSSTGTCPSGTCSGGSDNFNSLVVLVECASGKKALLSGDAYDRNEFLDYAKKVGKVDVLKIPHHGFYASGSSASAFKKLNPTYAIITNSNPSTKGVSYTLPTQGVLNWLPSTSKQYFVFDYTYVTVNLNREEKINIKLGSKR